MSYDMTDERVFAVETAARDYLLSLEALAPYATGAEHDTFYVMAQEALDELFAAVDALRGPNPELVQEAMRLSIALYEALDLLERAEVNVLGLDAGERLYVIQWYDDRRAMLARHGRGTAAYERGGRRC